VKMSGDKYDRNEAKEFYAPLHRIVRLLGN
jgi:hypothetical protein